MAGVERKIDNLGRVVIPIEYRRKLGVGADGAVLISMERDRIILTSAKKQCALCLCGGVNNVEIGLCDECISKVKKYSGY